MSDRDDNSLAARLAAQRLAKPGVLDRTPVERTYERVQQSAVRHELTERLHQRATASGEAGGSSFVWRRSPAPADASAEGLTVPAAMAAMPSVPAAMPSVPAAMPSVTAASSTPISRASSPVVQRAALPEAEAAEVTARLTSRAHSPGMLAVGRTTLRSAAPGSFGNAPAFAAHLQSRYGATSGEAAAAAAPVQAAPALSISRAPAGVVMRQADAPAPTAPPSSHASTSAVLAASRPLRAIAAAPMLARQASAATAMAGTLPLAGTGSLAAPDSRTADSPRAPGIPMMPAARPLLSAGSAAGAPLVLRRMLAAPVQSSTPVPAVLPPAVVQLPREETPSPLRQQPEPPVAKKLDAHTGSDIDRLAEEVGRRLMRRLRVERERRGIRQWR